MTKIYIGAGCNSPFVDLTCAMLSSLDDNADVAGATVIFVAFNLTALDKLKLRLSAGKLGPNVRFVDVDRSSDLIPALPSFDFPLPMLGCLIAPKSVTEAGARMLVLDSDMIVNSSLRPLFEMDLKGHPMAAVKDMLVEPELKVRGRKHDPNYFNTGLLLIDVDAWNARDLGNRAMRWLAAEPHKPEWPDQDALNHVVGADWLRLDRSWNLAYCGEERLFTYEEYAAARIAHFSGAKPTEHRSHPGVPLFDHQARRADEKIGWRERDTAVVDSSFIALAYEVLLGRELETSRIARERAGQPTLEAVKGFVQSDEFTEGALRPLSEGRSLPSDRWPGKPTVAHRLWAADRLPILAETSSQVEKCRSWRDLLVALVADERLMSLRNG